MIQAGSHWAIRPVRNLQRDGIPTYINELPPKKYDVVTVIYTLKNANSGEILKTIRSLPSKDGEVFSYTKTNQLIMTDFAPNIHRVWALLKEIDKPQKK